MNVVSKIPHRNWRQWQRFLAATAACLLCIAAEAAEFFVAPDGNPAATGIESAPWDLQTALNHPSAVLPGDTIWLRQGVYSTTAETFFIATINGSQAQPIVVRAYLGERATIDGRMDIRSNDTWYWNLEFTTLDPPPPADLTRTEQDQGYADGTYRLTNLEIRSQARNRLINNVIHNNHIGVSMSLGATDLEFYGNIVYHNGRLASDLPSGHGIYVQNEAVSGFKHLEDNIISNNFLNGLNPYSAGDSYVQNMEITGNILFSNGIEGAPLHGVNLYAEAPHPMQDLLIQGNFLHTPVATIDDPVLSNAFLRGVGSEKNVIIDGNILANGGLSLLFLDQFQLTGNRIGPGGELQLRLPQDINTPFDITIDNNAYSQLNFNPWFFSNGVYDQVNTGASNEGFIEWREILQDQGITGADAASTNSESSPQDLIVFLRPNEYESGRANLAILDFGNQQEIAVDVSLSLARRRIVRVAICPRFLWTFGTHRRGQRCPDHRATESPGEST